jgi:hypothetical protein
MARGVWGLWAEVEEPTRSELRAIYRELRAAHGGLPTRLARRYAKTVAELWVVTDRASQEAARLAGQRRVGQWKRSTRRLVTQAMKRQGLELYSLDQARQQLEALAGRRNGHGDPLDQVLADLRRGAGA